MTSDMSLAELRKKPHLSASAINDYIECGLLFKFSRIDKAKRDFTPDAMVFGTVIHRVLEQFYLARMDGEFMELETIHQIFENCLTIALQNASDIKYSKGKNHDIYRSQGKALLSAWHEGFVEDAFQVLATEAPFSFNLLDLPVPIIGALDLVEEDETGTVIITDFKTSAKAYSAQQIDQNQQMTVYHMAARKNGFADREILLRLDCLIKTKTPKFEQYYTTRDQTDETRLTAKILKVWDGIQKGVFVPNDTSWKCANCLYRSTCDEWFENGGRL